jgi:hypothetical protein
MTDEIRVAADAVRRQLEAKVETIKADPALVEATKLEKALNGLEDLLGERRTVLAHLLGFAGEAGIAATVAPTSVRPDEFAGLEQLEAAKKYLRRFTNARSFQEIVGALRNGGGETVDEEKLRVALGKSNWDVKKFGDHYGMKVNYPGGGRRGKAKAPEGGAPTGGATLDAGATDEGEEGEASE